MKTDKITLISIISLVVLVVILMVAAPGKNSQSNKVEAVATSALVADKELFDFGEIDIFGGKVTTQFSLTNNGSEDITILAGTTSCACTDADIGGITFGMHERMKDTLVVPAGGTENMNVIYDPLAHGPDATGLIQRSVFLKTNSDMTPEVEVRIKAMVIKNE
ncbi:MAG: DUF1573 domain-containing protein [Lewinellaceae bacterium]|nr:DUF1573 domain-containing protein [Lewinellaceae bacterium]